MQFKEVHDRDATYDDCDNDNKHNDNDMTYPSVGRYEPSVS